MKYLLKKPNAAEIYTRIRMLGIRYTLHPSFWKELFMWEGSSPSWGHMHKAPCVDLAQVGILLLIDLLTSGGVALNYLIKFRLCGGQMSVESEWSKHTFVLCAIYCSAHNKFYSVCNLDVGEIISILFKHFSGGFSPPFLLLVIHFCRVFCVSLSLWNQ